MTRRQFGVMLMTSAVALSAQAAGRGASTSPTGDMWIALIHSHLRSPMPAELASQVAEAVESLQRTVDALRSHSLPEGSEPAFTFRPTLVGKHRR